MSGNKKPAGIMVYFDFAPVLRFLNYEERGKIITAMLDYGEYAVIPEFGDNEEKLKMLWATIQPKIDRDFEAYNSRCMKNKYNALIKIAKEKGEEMPLYEVWLEEQSRESSKNRAPDASNSKQSQAIASDCLRPQPTITKSITPIESIIPITNATVEESAGRGLYEDYTKQTESEFENMRAKRLFEFEEHIKNK